MNPFDLKRALNGEPVKLRNGDKAIIKFNLNDEPVRAAAYSLVGYIEDNPTIESWGMNGNYYESSEIKYERDIIGMWEEPRPTVTLTLPCPLKEPREVVWFISGDKCYKSFLRKGTKLGDHLLLNFENRLYFAKEEDAQAWIDALHNNRR